MKKTRPQDFDPNFKKTNNPAPDPVDLSGIVPIKKRPRSSSLSDMPESGSKKHDSMPPSKHDTVIPRNHDSTIEAVRKAVKTFGKEAATHRFTVEEKQKIGEIVFKYKQKGIRTSENEITRIAVNYLIENHQSLKEKNILNDVLRALNN